MRIMELVPGMEFNSPFHDSVGIITYITQTLHPYYPGLQLVIWIMPNGDTMFDALNPFQQLPYMPLAGSPEIWRKNIQKALKLGC